jgi:hypothetical protein
MKKYVYANVKIPIEISDDGSFQEIFSDRMVIDFELCEALPDVCGYDTNNLINKIFSLHPQSNSSDNAIENDNTIINDDNGENVENNNTVDNSYNNDTESETEKNITIDLPIDDIIKITKNELQYKTPRKRQNISFKKRTSKGQYTRRNY